MSIGVIRDYYHLTKPGIIRGNLITAVAGYLLGAKGEIYIPSFAAIIVATCFVVASGCVFNNYIDRNIDAKMKRTSKRQIVAGTISGRNAIIFGIVLGISGIAVLFFWTNLLTSIIGMVGWIFYVIIYGLAKRKTSHATEIGTIPGAVSILAGYTAATNTIDLAAVLIFFAMIFWQIPHFYAIAIYRLNDYIAADIPVKPRKIGKHKTRLRIITYIIVFTTVAILPTIFGITGYIYLIGMLLAGGFWFYVGVHKASLSYETWAIKVFNASLLVLLVFSFLLSINNIVP